MGSKAIRPASRRWLPRLVREDYTAANAVDGSDMTGRSWTIVWGGVQVEIGVTRQQ